jgi:butyryl-CoA dehydrogenase
MEFHLFEVLDTDRLLQRPRFSDHDRDTLSATLALAHQIAAERFAPHAAKQDAHEPRFEDGRVVMIPEVADALASYSEAGFHATEADYAAGGLQLPATVGNACAAIFAAANLSTASYPMLTTAAANLLAACGTKEQQRRYMKPLYAGRFFGTMCLSEPQAGSSLADIRCSAEPLGDGRYRIRGSKMWISGGHHELAENIVHLVLARIPSAPPGVKGISLFVVPRNLLDAGGAPAGDNHIALAGLNHKMGQRGVVNCLLNFSERGDTIGELVGEPNAGLAYMFRMMNEARIAVGMSAAALACAGYLHALDYAKQRPQGRLPDNRDPASPQVMIIEHADVRRMLLRQKVIAEGALGLGLFAGYLVDEHKTATTGTERREAHLLLEILTPICKAWSSHYGLRANELAVQVLGGYGYTRDYPVERLYRDNRINPIHEGTNGIQSLDLLGRKVTMENGAAFELLLRRMQAAAQHSACDARLAEHAEALEEAIGLVASTTRSLTSAAGRGDLRLALANSHLYLELLGHIVIAWQWLEQARVAAQALDREETSDKDFYLGKLAACRYFYRFELPRIRPTASILESLDPTCLEIEERWF